MEPPRSDTSMPPPPPVSAEEALARRKKRKRRLTTPTTSAVANQSTKEELPPVARTRARVEALDEDEWVTKLEGIIERDFFPEIPKLQSKLEWLMAVNSGDAELIQQAQRNTALRRAGFKTPLNAKSKGKERERGGPKEWNTPLREGEDGKSEWDEAVLSLDRNSALRSPAVGNETAGTVQGYGYGYGSDGEQQKHVVPKLSLDQFCHRYTSEDNASFGEILAQANSRVKEKRDRLYSSVKRLEGSTDGYGSSNQPSAGLITWKHRPMNQLFYDSTQTGSASITEKEKRKLFVKGPEKQIVHRNTRINPTMDGRQPKASHLNSIFGSPSSMSVTNTPEHFSEQRQGRPTYRERERGRERGGGGGRDVSAVRGFIASPSPAPGVDESPFMTWGEVEGTPLLIKPMPERERLAHNLVHSTVHLSSLGNKKGSKRTTSKNTNHTPKGLSAAGLRLASRLRKKKSNNGSSSRSFRNTIRESYTPTPHHQ